jgi:SpoVK/Ycf46/Vps4 family AAA+-type ATPase
MDARVAAIRAAAKGADAYLTEQSAETIANRYPVQVDNLEHAMRLARNRPKDYDEEDPAVTRFTDAYKDLTSEGISHFAERLEPVFSLGQVVVPADRKQQLVQIVDHVRLAPKVLDGWRFRDQLPYGRGVSALFHGPSGTGKTMAAMGIARALGIQLLRLDLSRMVSKYIGDTEKNIDRVFTDAQRSGAAILIDEADALLGKRSEVKDAHDRYANIEIAYLLLRMEAFEGLAILTTNMRQNLDAAFLRRLRFIVDFPRPDVSAREQIWRQCLPEESHDLDDAAFRQLARRIDLTGGHIRQITLRAAFLAAAEDAQIDLRHIAEGARAELAKLGMPPVELDLNKERRAA